MTRKLWLQTLVLLIITIYTAQITIEMPKRVSSEIKNSALFYIYRWSISVTMGVITCATIANIVIVSIPKSVFLPLFNDATKR